MIRYVQFAEKRDETYTADPDFLRFDEADTIPVARVLYVKDKYLISDEKYNVFRNELRLSMLPDLASIRERRNVVNSSLNEEMRLISTTCCFTNVKREIED